MEQKLRNAAECLPETNLEAASICGLARLEQGSRKPGFSSNGFGRVLAAMACLVLLIGLGFGGYAYAAEVKEYNAAVAFFAENNLSTEGLTREEIKAVYKDIITESFSYGKTGEVIKNSLTSEQIGGYEIWQGEPTPEDVENLWNYKNYDGWFVHSVPESVYSHRSVYDYSDVYNSYKASYVEKHDGDSLVWSVRITDFYVQKTVPVSDGVIAYGDNYRWSSGQTQYAWMAKIDAEGNLLWTHKLDNGFENEYIAEILENADGSYAVISRGDLKYFCLSQYASDGMRTLFNKTEIGNRGIWNAARFGDGYIVQLGSYMENEYARIVKVDREGNITDSFSYSSENSNYYIKDMIEFDGRVYLSAYATPKLGEDERTYGGRTEIARILDYVFSSDNWAISGEELTPIVRDNYTAILLVCDPTSGTPKTFFSVKGSLGASLEIRESGQLLWKVESITSTFFSPATSSFTIGGASYVYLYTFGEDGALVSREKTGEVVDFRR